MRGMVAGNNNIVMLSQLCDHRTFWPAFMIRKQGPFDPSCEEGGRDIGIIIINIVIMNVLSLSIRSTSSHSLPKDFKANYLLKRIRFFPDLRWECGVHRRGIALRQAYLLG